MSLIYLNGDYIQDSTNIISYRDSGFTTGVGIFDSMLALGGEGRYADEHYARIIHDSKIVIGLTPPLGFEKFEEIYTTLLKKNKLDKGYARIRTTITGGIVKSPLAAAHTPTILIEVRQASNPESAKPVTCAIITDFPRVAGCILENCKRLDYSRSYAARRKAESLGATEAILTNTEGNIACGTTSNIFIEENGVLITPPLSEGILAGVTRKKLIEDGNIGEEIITQARLLNADKVYLINSFTGFREVEKIIS